MQVGIASIVQKKKDDMQWEEWNAKWATEKNQELGDTAKKLN